MNNRILILLLYYDRPLMVRNALRSVLKANEYYTNWELAFIDDASPRPGRPIAEEVLSDHLDQVRFFHTGLSGDKKRIGDSMVGKTMNEAIAESNADLAIMLCDDDELCDEYLLGLADFFEHHTDCTCCYSHVHEYNPAFERSEFVQNLESHFNSHQDMINPHLHVDASQVAWRTSLNHKMNVWFPWPQTKWLDASFYHQIGALFPQGIPFSGLVGQYKGVHAARLVNHDRDSAWDGSFDVPECRAMTPREHIYAMVWRYGRMGIFQESKRICQLGLEIYPDDQLLLNSIKFNEGG